MRCNSVDLGVFAILLVRLQSVMNAAARLIFSARKSEHISPSSACELHWQRVSERIRFRLCVLARFVAFTTQRRHRAYTLPTAYAVLLMSTPYGRDVIFALPITQSRYRSVKHLPLSQILPTIDSLPA